MDAVTYPESSVSDFISKNLIAMRLRYDEEPYASQFTVKWTPKICILDSNGNQHRETVGFFPPEELIPSLELGLAKVDFDIDCLEECTEHLDNILTKYPHSQSAAEAVYLKGVVGYKKSGEAEPLKTAYYKLQEEFPDSEWTIQASPYRLL